MKKRTGCLLRVENCEDCAFWEPIPFHQVGGVCVAFASVRRPSRRERREVETEGAHAMVDARELWLARCAGAEQ